MTQVDDSDAILNACSNDVRAVITPLMTLHDTRLVFACLAAEVAYIGALLRTAKTYTPQTVARVLAEAMATSVTLEVKQPKIVYSDGTTSMETKQ